MNISEIARMLADNAQQVSLKLLPNGVKVGNEWKAGDVTGSKGDSLGVCLTGAKAGVWCDFATGESGDLIDLWAASRHNGSIKDALDEIRRDYGIHEPAFSSRPTSYERPPKPNCGVPKNHAMEYLESRGFTKKTIADYKVAADNRVIYFPFLRDGELIMCKWRSIEDKKTAPTTSGQEPCLFGWQAIPDSARSIYITEGEFDAMALYQMGYPALSVPFGGGSGAKQQWIDNEYDSLERFDTIYLCMDTDEMGVKATKEIAERLGIERCLWVTLPAKDANECLKQGLDITDAISKAKHFDPEMLKQCAEFLESVKEKFYPSNENQEFIPIPWDKARGKLELREYELSLWNGMNGSGKSQVAGFIALRALQENKRVCIASMELRPEILLKRMVKQAAATPLPSKEYIDDIINELSGLWLFHCVGTAKKDEMLKTIRYARKRYGIDLFVIDSLLKCGIAEDDYNGQKEFMDELCDLKNELGCHIMLVTHSRKKDSERDRPGKMDIRGATAISDLADTVINIWRNKPKEEKLELAKFNEDDDVSELVEQSDVYLRCDKQRNGEWEGTIGLFFDTNSYQYLEHHTSRAKPIIKDWRKNNAVSR